MTVEQSLVRLLIVIASVGQSAGTFAQAPKRPASKAHVPRPAVKTAQSSIRMVAYDARDLRYYPLSWAKAHGMRDPAGDPLVPLPMARLPRGANPTLVPGK